MSHRHLVHVRLPTAAGQAPGVSALAARQYRPLAPLAPSHPAEARPEHACSATTTTTTAAVIIQRGGFVVTMNSAREVVRVTKMVTNTSMFTIASHPHMPNPKERYRVSWSIQMYKIPVQHSHLPTSDICRRSEFIFWNNLKNVRAPVTS